MVERRGIGEHRHHIFNSARDEVRDVTVEGGGVIKHIAHIYNAARVEA